MGDGGKVEVEVSKWFENLVEEVITRVTFGDTNYDLGRAIFRLQSQQMANATEAYQKICFPGHRFLPTRKNRVARRLEREIRDSLLKLIELRGKSAAHREHSPGKSSDLLEVMMGDGDSTSGMTAAEVAEECKTIFFAGKHTTSNLLTWTTVLLSMHPHWQEQAREEVLRVCGARDTPTRDDLAKLKTLSMILYESLRLYPPAVAIIRRATRDVHLGHLRISGGTELLIPILVIHHDPALWCNDPHEFNPGRFSKGVAHAAKHPMALMPFGMGARRCIGQNLAMLQAKLAMTMILQRFSFELAPSYQHAPSVEMLLQPQHGAPIVFTKL